MFLDKLFGTEKPRKAPVENACYLMTANSLEELSVIESILRSADVRYLTKERGAGEVAKIVVGQNLFGTDIYVDKEQKELAEALLTPCDSEDETEETEEE